MSGPVLIAAGGTGGHMFPALALGRELKRRGIEVAVLTDARGRRYLERRDRLPRRERRQPVRQPAGAACAALLSLARGFAQSLPLLRGLHPVATAAFGGYACVPAALASALSRVPVLVHEQNAVFGRANRLIARFARVLALSFADTAACRRGRSGSLPGNPVRPGFDAGSRGYEPPAEGGPIRILVMGGSQGARVFSDVVPAAVALLSPGLRARLELAQQCRPEDLERVRAAYAGIGMAPSSPPSSPTPRRECHRRTSF